MKVIISNYTFNAAAKTVTFNDYGSILLDNVLIISNVVDNLIIYNFADPLKGGSVVGNVLTLEYDTTAMSNTDALQIWFYDENAVKNVSVVSSALPSGAATAANQQTDALTDVELRATPVPIVGIVSTGGLTDAQLRATPVPVSASIDTTGLATSANQSTEISGLSSLLTELQLKADLTETQPVSAASLPLPTGAAIAANQQTDALTNTQLRAVAVPVSGTFFQATQPVSATNLDIRDLTFAADKIDASGSIIAAVVSATDLDIRNLAFATDKVDASGSVLGPGTNNIGDVDVLTLPSIPAGTNNIGDVDVLSIAAGDNNIGNVDIVTMPPVTATDLDIRNLIFATDKVDVSGSSGIGVTGTFFQATQPVSAASLPLPTGAATSALQTQPGVDIGDVTVNNAAGAAAVNVQDGGNSITVDGTFFQATQPVSATDLDIRNLVFATDKVDASGTVLGAGTNNIGDVDVLTLPALPAGTNNIGDVDILSIVPGTAATNLGKAEDVAHVTGDTGVMALGVSNEGGTALVNANGDYTPIATDKMGQIYVNPENNKVLFRGRSSTFRTPGRAGTAGQKILSLHNATGSSISLTINKVFVDLMQTVIKAVTVAPPIIRLWKVTVLPTNGTSLTKNKIGGTTTSSASVTVLGDASADGTGSGTTLTATLPAGAILSQEFAPRIITAVGYEMADRMEFLGDTKVTLAALEGVVIFLDYTLATQNPTTDMWIAGLEWQEYTT